MNSFQKKVLELTLKVPRGKATTYKEIANALNCRAYRAVGKALNKNPRPDKYPCYKVVKESGEIGGFALGVEEKVRRLEKEGIKINKGKVSKEQIFRFSDHRPQLFYKPASMKFLWK